MMGLDLNEIISKIKEKSGLSEEDIKLQISQKRDKLAGLVSEEGAAHIIANSLGVDLMESIRKHGLKIDKLQPGMRIGVTGKVVKTYEVRSFTKGDRVGKVGSFLVGDETGLIRIVLWDETHIAKMESGEIKGDVLIKVENGNVRENNGYKEMHLGNYSKLDLNPPGVEDIKVIQTGQPNGSVESGDLKISKLNEANAGDNISIYGTIVQVYDPRFYDGCPECGKKVVEGNCPTHQAVTPKKIPILNFFVDDGHGGMRGVAFREEVAKVLDVEETEVEKFSDDLAAFEATKVNVLGSQMVFTGRVTSNQMYDRNEFMVRAVHKMDAKEVLAKFIN